MKRLAGMASLLSLLLPAFSSAADYGVDGTTIIRLEQRTAPGVAKQTIAPATQYLGIDADGIGVKELSLHLYGWGRFDLADNSGESTNPKSTDGNLTYGYLLYRFPNANAQVKAGRFFMYEGVAAEQVDGLAARTDLAYGLTVSAYGGVPVKLDRGSATKGDFIGGGRLGYRYGGILDLGVSGLSETNSPTATGKGDRRLVGADLWLSPVQMIELSGRSSYNTTTKEIAEHTYQATLRPTTGLTFNATFNDVRLADYFAFTNIKSLFSPTINEKYRSFGGSVTYRLAALPFPVEATIDYMHFKRDSIGDSDRIGAEVRVTPIERLSTGFSYARVAAANGIMSYNEVRGFALYGISRYTASLDLIGDIYDDKVYDKKVAYEIAASAGYQILPMVRLSGDVSYADNPWYDGEFKGLVRITVNYTTVKGAAQ